MRVLAIICSNVIAPPFPAPWLDPGHGARPAIRRESRCRASLSRVACAGSRRRPNSSRRSETRSKPEAFGDGLHQALILGVLELDHLAGIDVDQVVVVAMLGRLVAGAAAAEVAALEDALLLQQAHRAVDRGDRDPRVECAGAAIQFLDVRMIGCLGQHPCDDPTLPGHLEASFDAQALDAQFHRIPSDQPSPAGSPGASPR